LTAIARGSADAGKRLVGGRPCRWFWGWAAFGPTSMRAQVWSLTRPVHRCFFSYRVSGSHQR
jgi:hypothetical protein